MQKYEVMQLCRTIVSRRIKVLEEDLNSIFDLLSKEESEAPQQSGAPLKMSLEPEPVMDMATIVLDNTEPKAPIAKKAVGKPLKFDEAMFLTVNPIYNKDDYIDEIAVLFSNNSQNMDFMEFFSSFNFSLVLSSAKYYPIDIAKQIYCSMTGADPDSFDVLCYLNKKEYFKGVIAYKRNNLYAFNAKGFMIIQENIKKYGREEKVLPPATIPDFLINMVDLDKVTSENLSIADLAKLYEKLYGKTIDDRIIRNALTAKHITVLSVFGDKRPAKGEALAEMLRRYKKLRSGTETDKNTALDTQKPYDKLYTSIGELVKNKLKTTLNK